jgi:hypothetical protein
MQAADRLYIGNNKRSGVTEQRNGVKISWDDVSLKVFPELTNLNLHHLTH